MSNPKNTWLVLLGSWFLLGPAHSDPVINSVDTDRVQSEGVVVINGRGFGERPVIHVLDTFEHSGAAVGDIVALDKARLGAWTRHGTNPPTYDGFARSGRFSARMAGPDVGMRQLTHDFSQPVQTVFISYWVAIPPGYPFPGQDDIYDGFPSNSAWKFAWLIDEDYQGNSSDVIVPQYNGQNTSSISGNDGMLSYIAKPSTWWSWGNWMRIAALLEANPNAPTDDGRLLVEIYSQEHGLYRFDKNTPVFDKDGPFIKQYQYINFPGWFTSFELGEARPLYDDIYVASGPNAGARIEISDNPDYEKSDYIAIMQVESWDDTRIEASMAPVYLQEIASPSFHVFDRTGRRIEYEDGSPPPDSAPNPPTDVSAE